MRTEKTFLTLLKVKSKGAGISNFDHCKLKILTAKQMLQRLLIALAQVQAGNNSEILLNEIRYIVLSIKTNQRKNYKIK